LELSRSNAVQRMCTKLTFNFAFYFFFFHVQRKDQRNDSLWQ